MKHFLTFSFLVVYFFLFGQNNEPIYYSPFGVLDTVFYEHGKTTLDNIRVDKVNIDPTTGQVKSTNLFSCNSGYFELYIEDGSGFENLPASNPMAIVHQERRAVLCQIFSDISNFISSPLTTTGEKVRIWVRDISTQPAAGSSTLLGRASAFYVFPQNGPQPGYGGIVDNEIWKTIHLGSDSYQNVIPSLASGGASSLFYHGMVTMNFDPLINWNTNLSLTTIPSNQHDLYSILLHEITHALGFSSRIDFDGTSKFGPNYNYFTRFDSHLKNNNLTQFLIKTNSQCGLYNFGWNNVISTNMLHPGCSQLPPVNLGLMSDFTDCSQAIRYSSSTLNIPVYTPTCYEDGSSLSHFEDMCFPTPNSLNNAYFCMANAGSTGMVRRVLTPQERQVLCDIGYTVGSTFGVAPNNTNYATSQCPGITVAGTCDGITGTTLTFVGNATSTSPITISGILANDHNATGFTCFEDITDPNATISNVSGTNTTPIQLVSSINGLHILRYIPVNAAGEQGNITYVYAFVSGGCTPDMCNLINNGGFENSTGCGNPFFSSINCWSHYIGLPELYKRNCFTNSGGNNIPILTNGIDTWDAPNPSNDNFLKLYSSSNNSGSGGYVGAIQAFMNTNLIPGNSYQFRIRVNPTSMGMNPPVLQQLSIYGANGFLSPLYSSITTMPLSLSALNSVTLSTTNQWQLVEMNFIPTQAFNNVVIANNTFLLNPANGQSNILIDDIELIDLTLSPPLNLPAVVCINQTPTFDPGNAPVGGDFSGPGTAANGSFNPVAAGVGVHEIAYTFTNNNGCQQTIFDQVEVVNSTISVSASASNSTVCSGQSVTLSAQSSGATNFVWNPGLVSGATISTTVNASTNFQVTATNAEGCVASAAVPVIAIQNSATIAGASTICEGQTTTLTASGGTSYTWSPGGQTTASISVSPSATTTYTVTATNANGCTATATKTVTVNPSPTPTIAGANFVCQGQATTLTASGGTSYTWSPGGQTTASISVSPSVTTTYTVTATNANGCVGTATKTVTVNAIPTVTVSPTSTIVCSGQTTILTPFGANSYTWSPTSSLSAGTGNSVSATPSTTTTYTVTGTSNGCSATASSTITVQPCTDCSGGTVWTGLTTGTTAVTTTLQIPNNITITGNVTLTNCNVKIHPNVTITVSPAATLNIVGSHLYGCEAMWEGIVVQAGGKVNIIQVSSTKTTLIEDATIALDYLPITTSQTVAVLQVNNATFNKNATAIRIQGYPHQNVASIFSVVNSLFTCRNNIYNTAAGTWATTTAVKVANNNTNPYVAPYINSNTISGYPLAYLKAPAALNTRSERGIVLSNIGTTTYNGSLGTYFYNSMQIGASTVPSDYNLFDNLQVAIYADIANFTVQKSHFQYPAVIPLQINNPSTYEPPLGTAIYSKCMNGQPTKVEVVGTSATERNNFYGHSNALYTKNVNDVRFAWNNVRSNRTNIGILSKNGDRAIYMHQTTKFANVNIQNNTFYNIKTGVSLICNISGLTPTITISNNQFHKTLGTQVGANSEDAILVQNGTSLNFTGGSLAINSNIISGTKRGIGLSNWKGMNTQINSNAISFGLTGSSEMYGISLKTCDQGSIANNNIAGSQPINYAIAQPNTLNINYRAIQLFNSTNNKLNCNAVSNSYAGLYFSGTCSPTKTSNNTMQNHRYGFVLADGGIIGQQGAPAQAGIMAKPADNRWLGTWTSGDEIFINTTGSYKNACLNGSYSNNSLMYVRNTSSGEFTPANSTMQGTFSLVYQTAAPQTLFDVTNPQALVSCLAVTPAPVEFTAPEVASALEENTATLTSTTVPSTQKAVMQDQTYRTLDADQSLLLSNTNLNTFYDTVSLTNTKTLLDVEKALYTDSLSLATTKYTAVTPQNSVEESYKLYYGAYINYKNGVFSSADSLTIISLAQACPTLQGDAVHMAAVLYNVVYYEATVFSTICPEYIDKSMTPLSDESEVPLATFSIHPVPNNGVFHLLGALEQGMRVQLFDLNGRLVFTKTLEVSSSNELLETHLQAGTYTLVVKNTTEQELYRTKTVIIQ